MKAKKYYEQTRKYYRLRLYRNDNIVGKRELSKKEVGQIMEKGIVSQYKSFRENVDCVYTDECYLEEVVETVRKVDKEELR